MQMLDLASADWSFRSPDKLPQWRSAVVPGCVHRDLLRHGLIPDPFFGTNELELQWIEECAWEYRAEFAVSAELLAEKVVELVADGLDTVATVTLNGRRVAATENMFIGYRWDVRPLLRAGRNTLRIRFDTAAGYIRAHRADWVNPREIHYPVSRGGVIRKQQCQFGWDWGPRFVTSGVWRDIRLEAWSGARLDSVRGAQTHGRDRVDLTLAPEFAGSPRGAVCAATVSLAGEVVAAAEGAGELRCRIDRPRLWWPAGQGEQPLYDVEVVARDRAGRELGRWGRRIGLRTIALDRHPDRWGESFQFVVNGRALFIKGANWIPAHSFVAGLGREDYARDLRAAVAAHMNCVRLWGGGVYELEPFYDLCDELGLLVWHDFMFACSLYPGDRDFVATVREEAVHQVRRLRHRACLALWCGNNELTQLNWPALQKPGYRRDYEAIFHRVLPRAVAEHDGATDYWPSSQWRGSWAHDNAREVGTERGDTHYWDVWHARHPVKDYEKWAFRFASEFGMQSYSSAATQATFCPPGDANVFAAPMENHQKNGAGNQIILDYVSRRYRFPKSQDALIYLSQLNQAHCMQVGVEHYRRNMPRCMGAIYWQLNDCWPVASWSSIEFTGRWKALHHAARRFYAPALATVHVPGDEKQTIGNYRVSTVREAHLHTVYDGVEPRDGRLRWQVRHVDGRVLLQGAQPVALEPQRSVRHRTLDLAALIAEHAADVLYLRLALELDGRIASEDTTFLTPPRFVRLPRGRTKVNVRRVSATEYELGFTSDVFQHRFEFDLAGAELTASDNYFELYPGERKAVMVRLARPLAVGALRRALKHRSLVDTYE